MQEHNKASEWFEDFYDKNKNSHENIPWAKQRVNTQLQRYIDEHDNHKGKALVIGCGLGDDAYALEQAQYEVIAIDISSTALDIAKQRFPNSKVKFEVQDIFDMPDEYNNCFDFVFESLTIQSLPIKFRNKMIEAVSNTLKINAKILVIAHKSTGVTQGPPWPLTKEEIDLFKSYNLKEESFELVDDDSMIARKKFRVLYTKEK